MTTDFSLIAYTTERHTRKLTSKCPGNRLSKRGFTYSRRPYKTENRFAIDLSQRFLGLQRLCRSYILCFDAILYCGHFSAALHLLGQAFFLQTAHRQVFKNAIFDFLQIIMVLVKYLACMGHVNLLTCALAPGQAGQQLQVRPNDAIFW